MILLFSEAKSDYTHYIFPYAVWAIPEKNETISQIFSRGFLPGSRHLDRFYLCRQIRVRLTEFIPSSENRRILRKGKDFSFRLMDKNEFEWNRSWRNFCKQYADIKFGYNVMTYSRLDGLFQSPIISHVLIFHDESTDKDVGLVTLYLEPPHMAYYYYAFYDLNYFKRNLGMFMMTSAVLEFQNRGFDYLYLGTCYSKNALYKTQFRGAEFFNGFDWSSNLQELKFLIKRDKKVADRHLLETDEFIATFYEDNFENIQKRSLFKLR